MTIDPVIESGDLWHAERLKTKRMLTSSGKYYLLKHPFVLNKMFKFPVQKFGDHNQRFQNGWLDKYNGLTYSISDDGGYCKKKICALFAP